MTSIEFGTYEIDCLEIVPILSQTGYLTIKDTIQSPDKKTNKYFGLPELGSLKCTY